MVWIECDCCGRTLARHEAYFRIRVERAGVSTVPMRGNTHLCETCFMAIRKAAEVIKHG